MKSLVSQIFIFFAMATTAIAAELPDSESPNPDNPLSEISKNEAIKGELPSAGISLEIERVGGMTHFEFSGQNEWQYDLTKKGKKVMLTLPKLSSAELEKLENFSSLLVNKVSIDNEVPNKTKIELELINEKIESFDYLTQKPNNLIIDIYASDEKLLKKIQETQSVAQREKERQSGRGPASVGSANGKGGRGQSKKGDRNPAFAEFFVSSDDGGETSSRAKNNSSEPLPSDPPLNMQDLFDFGSIQGSGLDDGALEAKVIEAEGNIYLRFPLLKLENKHLKELQSFRPEYEILKSKSDENKQARDLLKLFNQRSFASFIKAKKLFKNTFPESTYDEILNYVEADTWIELWKINGRREYLNNAMNIYKMLIEKYPNSKISERTTIYAALQSHDVDEYFVATKLLRRYLKRYPSSPFNNHIKIYLADSLAHLKNYEGASNALAEVVESDEAGSSVEALFRMGDVYFLKQSFRRAEATYMDAIKAHPKLADQYPNALFNMAESQFNLAEYPASLANFTKFSQTYPNHPYSGYALTRAGELIDILHKDKKRAQGFYNESFYRFRKTTGGAIARMRSLSQRFKDMKDVELKSAIDEIKHLEKEIDLHQIDEFSAFMISDGHYSRSEYLNAANALISYFQTNPKPVNIQKFEKRISRSIAGEVRQLIKNNEIIPALSIIETHQKSWLSKSRRVDVQYFRALAYERMKLFDEARDSYKVIEKRMSQLKGTKEETERKVFEYYPTFDQIHLRQAVVEYALDNRKAALDLLKKVKKVGDLEPQSKTDYHYTLSRLSFDNKNYEDALKTISLVDLDNIEDPEKREKINVYLSDLYERNKMFDKAISILEQFHAKNKGDQDKVYILTRLFHLYRDKGLSDKAIKTGQELLNDYGNKYNLDKERYYLGEMHFAANNLKEAQRVWKDLTKKSMWSELARNKEVSDEWKQKTNDSIKRIPAMAK